MTSEPEESLGMLVGRLADDARAYAHAEVAYYRTLVVERLGEAQVGLAFAGIALVLAIAGAIGLVVGSLMALATLLGPGWATLIVTVVTFAIAGLLGWASYRRLARIFRSGP